MIHYSNPIAERFGDKYILNKTSYSLKKGQLKKKAKETIPGEKRMPSETKISLSDFVEK